MTAFDRSAHAEAAEATNGQNITVDLEWHGQAAVLAVAGDIDMATAPQFEEALTSALDRRPDALVVDLARVDFFASAGLTALVATHQQAGERTELRLVAASSATVRPLQVTALDRKIPVYSSREEALTSR